MLRRVSTIGCHLTLSVLLLVLLAACPAGRGEGWVVGSLFVEDCQDGASLDKQGDYDLRADFYAGDPLFDSSASAAIKRSRLFVRIQETSNPVSESNSLTLQFQDMTAAAQAFAAGEVLRIEDDSLLPASMSINAVLRLQLQLYTTCPSNQSPLHGLGWPLEEKLTPVGTRQEICMQPATAASGVAPVPDCPQLDAAQRAELDQLCDDPDFDDRQARGRIEALLGSGKEPACLYLCKLGNVTRGTPAEELRGFELDFGQTISALFVSKVVDGRAVRLGRCAHAWGQLTGRFRFTLVRSRAAQPFP